MSPDRGGSQTSAGDDPLDVPDKRYRCPSTQGDFVQHRGARSVAQRLGSYDGQQMGQKAVFTFNLRTKEWDESQSLKGRLPAYRA